MKKIIEENEGRFGLLLHRVNKKKETCKLEGAILPCKENLPKSDMNAGKPLYFLLLFKKYKRFFLSAYNKHHWGH